MLSAVLNFNLYLLFGSSLSFLTISLPIFLFSFPFTSCFFPSTAARFFPKEKGDTQIPRSIIDADLWPLKLLGSHLELFKVWQSGAPSVLINEAGPIRQPPPSSQTTMHKDNLGLCINILHWVGHLHLSKRLFSLCGRKCASSSDCRDDESQAGGVPQWGHLKRFWLDCGKTSEPLSLKLFTKGTKTRNMGRLRAFFCSKPSGSFRAFVVTPVRQFL